LIDPHVHQREPGATHKEDWESGTKAALAGGFTTVLAMPNTNPPVTNATSLALALKAAHEKACCDYAQYLGAGTENLDLVGGIARQVAGLKMYLDQTYGPLRLDEMIVWMQHLERWPRTAPVVVHAEGRTLAAMILVAALYDRSIHLAHISRREEILLVRKAKEKGIKVTCEVTPHHLFLSEEDIPCLGQGRSEVRPRLATASDRDSLWENLAVIDCFASDHAPHTLGEKDGTNPPPGFPGLETSLPLFLTAVKQGRLSLDDLVLRMHTNPKRIFDLPDQPDTWIEIDPDQAWVIDSEQLFTRCAWTPFQGWSVQGCVRKVVLRGVEAFHDGKVLVSPGFGKNLRSCDLV